MPGKVFWERWVFPSTLFQSIGEGNAFSPPLSPSSHACSPFVSAIAEDWLPQIISQHPQIACMQKISFEGERQPRDYFDIIHYVLSIHVSVTTIGMWVKMPKLEETYQLALQLPALQLTTQLSCFFVTNISVAIYLALPSAFRSPGSKSPKTKRISFSVW